MKKNFTLSLLFISIAFFAQSPPVIEATYYPVKNTSIKQVWDVTPGSMSVPAVGSNKIWDYRKSNGQFNNVVDTFRFKILDPATTPYKQYFPTSNQCVFIRTPFTNFSDSLFYYFKVNQKGTYIVGGFNIKKIYDSTIIYSKNDFYSPPLLNYGDVFSDTSRYVAYAKKYQYLGNPYSVKIKGTKFKTLSYVGYGTLKLPNGTYNNVAQIVEVNNIIDSIYVDFSNTGNYVYTTINASSAKNYNFFRNNTFGSAFLAYLSANTANTQVQYGWYTLPVDFGSISGTVYTNASESTPVVNGEMYLYRENSNFAKNDILAKTTLDINGNYKFDSIPFGEYRIAARPNATLYPNSKITYVGDTTNWIDATSIITTTITSPGHKIHLQYSPAPSGANSIVGNIGLNLNIARTSGIASVNPVKGVGVVIKKNPGNSAERVLVTDTTGKFNTGNLNDGAYKVFVDIPGLHMTGTYNFTVSNGTTVNGLDFTVGTDSIHPTNISVIGIKEYKNSSSDQFLSVFPNPYTNIATIVVANPQASNLTLEVYNMLGEKVQTIENSIKQAGLYTYSFSAKSINLSSGMYFVKLTVGNKTNVIKIVEQ